MYVDEMWLECVQGRAMQDVLAAKAKEEAAAARARRRHEPAADAGRRGRAADAARRPAEAAGAATCGGQGRGAPARRPDPKPSFSSRTTPKSATPLPTTEATDEADVAASHELLSNLSPPPNTTAQRGVRLAVRAAPWLW